MIDKTFARVALLTAVIGVHIASVVLVTASELPTGDEDGSGETDSFDVVALSKQFFLDIQDESELFQILVNLVVYKPTEENSDPDHHHCLSVKKAASVDILSKSIDLFLGQCISTLKKLGAAVNERVKDFLEVIESFDQLAYEDALACVELGDQINYEPILQCLDNVLNYRELSLYGYLEDMRQNYLTFNRRLRKLNECGASVITLIEDEIQTLLDDLVKCASRIENIETFFEETYDEVVEWSGDQGKEVVTVLVSFSLTIIMDRIKELKTQLTRKAYHEEVTYLAESTANVLAHHKEALDAIAQAAMLKVEDTERMGAHFNQCTLMIAEETNIRLNLANEAIHKCVDESGKIQEYFTGGISSYGEDIQTEYEKQMELILTCAGKLMTDIYSPSSEEVTEAVNCLKFKLLFTSDKSFIDLEEKVQAFLTSTREKIAHFDNNLETLNICTRATVLNFEEIAEDNSELIDLCVEEKTSQHSEKEEL